MKNVVILGSTGSIGVSTLEVIRRDREAFTITGLAAGNNINLLRRQISEFAPRARKAHIDIDPSAIDKSVHIDIPVVGHVRDVLRTSPRENLAMIADTVAFLKERDKEVFFDAEHFFDGYKEDPEYAMQAVDAAVDAVG